MAARRRERRRQAGVSSIEFVLSILPVLILVGWLMEYAMVQLDEYRVQDLAIAAADAISDAQTSDDASALAQNLVVEAAALSGIQSASVESISWSGPVQYGTTYQIVVGATHTWLFGPFQAALGSSARLHASAYGAIAARNLSS